MVHRVGGHHRVDRLAVLVEEVDRVERDLDARGAPHRDAERVVADDLELETLLLGHPVERAAVGVRDVLGRDEDPLEQSVDVPLLREGDPDVVELLEAPEQIVRAPVAARVVVHGMRYLMQTARTCWMSVIPCNTFSIPSCLRVLMPSSRAVANISDTRACSWMFFLMRSVPISSSGRASRPL